MIRYAYNHPCIPPAPFAHVTLRYPPGGIEITDLPAQLDTAADRPAVPRRAMETLGAAQTGIISVEGFGGHRADLPAYTVVLEVRQLRPVAVKVVAAPGEDFVLLGRDVLNHFRISLLGPEQALAIG